MTNANGSDHKIIDVLQGLRQTRAFTEEPIPESVVADLLEVARWTGSSKNSQPWHFVVVDDREDLKHLAGAGGFTGFIEGAALAVVILLDGQVPRANAYDEGRVSERLMLAGAAHGLGSGTGWFSTPEAQQQVRDLLDIPAEWDVWSAVVFGHPVGGPQPGPPNRGRHPIEEIVSRGRYGIRPT
ncbi:MAG: nitroreductase family protein [Propionibacteriaceae bacterium]